MSDLGAGREKNSNRAPAAASDKALQEERNKFRRILDGFHQGVYMVNRDYDVEYTNSVFQGFFGLPAGRKCYTYLHGLETPCPWCKNSEVMEEGRCVHWEITHPVTGRVFALYDAPVRNPDGSVSKIEFVDDVTDRRLAEAESKLLHEIVLGIGEAETFDAALTHILRRICETTGWIVGEAWLPGADSLQLHPAWYGIGPELESFRRASLGFQFRKGAGLPGVVALKREPVWFPDVTIAEVFQRVVAASSAGLRAGLGIPVLSRGEVVMVLVFLMREARPADRRLMDLAAAVAAQIGHLVERKRADEALGRERELIESTIRSLPGVFYLFDDQGRYLRWNRNLETVSGYSADEIARMHPLEFVPEDQRENVRRRIESVMEQGTADVEADLLARDGTRIPFYFTGVRVLLDGRPHLVGVGIDISKHRMTENHLRRSQQLDAVGRLAGGMAHEFNNILTVVMSAADLTSAIPGLPAAASEGLAQINTAAARAAELAEELRRLARR